jgi:MoaA/NifB/PqqE/SkfB family radical SAM enzyme
LEQVSRRLALLSGRETDPAADTALPLRRHPETPTLEAWRGLATGTLTFDEYYRQQWRHRRLSFLTIDVTGVCDLKCSGMCYYHPDTDKRKALAPEESLRQAITEADQHLHLQTLVLAGKEPFLNPKRLFSLLRYCGPSQERGFTVGIITNGRHIARHWHELVEVADVACLDFLDISLDSGNSAQHDAIRGRAGTFALAMQALREASIRLPTVRTGVSSVLRDDNAEGIIELLGRASAYTPYFFIAPVQPPPFVAADALTSNQVIDFLQRLRKVLETFRHEHGLEITVLLPGPYIADVIHAGLFAWEDLAENPQGSIYATTRVGDHSLLYACSVLPEQACRVARIAYDGAYLGHVHFLQTQAPETYATGYVQHESIVRLYEKAIAPDSHFHRLLRSRQSHQCRGRSCWTSCFGGWTVADNALITGESLETKPRLCRKDEFMETVCV